MVKLVVIDDEALIRRGIIKIIEMSKDAYSIVGEASDGEEGLRLLVQAEPDVAIVDVKMPKMNGLEMIKQYQEHHAVEKEVHFIILSAYDDYLFTRQAIKLDICDYLLKPVNRFELLEQLQSVVRTLYEGGYELKEQEFLPEAEGEEGVGDLINKSLEYIKQNFYQDLSLGCVAEHMHMHPNYFGNLFKKRTGVSFLTYLTNVRIEKAKQLLDNPELKIYEICQIVGYYSPKHFSKVFKKNVNMTPNEYRSQKKDM